MSDYRYTPAGSVQEAPRRKWWVPILWLLAETCALVVICILPAASIAWTAWYSVEQSVSSQASIASTAQAVSELSGPPEGWKRVNAAFPVPGMWYRGTNEDDLADLEANVSNGAYLFTLDSHDDVIWYQTPDVEDVGELTDFYVAVDAARAQGSAEDVDYGLVFRYTRNRYYTFGITNYGISSISERKVDTWVTLQDWTSSPEVREDVINRLAVLGKGSHFWFFINDQLIQEIENADFANGDVGVYVALDAGNQTATIVFENFTLYVPQD